MKLLLLITVLLGVTGCCQTAALRPAPAATQPVSSAQTDWPPDARAAVYSHSAAPSWDSPEGVTALLEKRWPLAAIQAACTAQTANPDGQALVLDEEEAWKGRLYEDRQTGFGRISWYAAVRHGRVVTCFLSVYRGKDYWNLEGLGPDTVQIPK